MSIWRAIWITLIFSLISFLVFSLLILPKYIVHFGSYSSYFWIIVNIFTQIISFWIIHRIYIKETFTLKNNEKVSFNIFFILILLAFGEYLAGIILVDFNDFVFSIPKYDFTQDTKPPIFYFILRLIKGCIVAAVIEEYFFRRYLQEKLRENYSNTFAIVFASILFSLYHFDLKNILPAFGLGLIYGSVFHISKNIKYSICLHAISNFLVYTAGFYWSKLDMWLDEKKYSALYFFVIIIGLAMIYFGFSILIKNIRRDSFENFATKTET